MLSQQNRLYNVGIYARLSKDDERNAKKAVYQPSGTSISIEHQVQILTDYAKEQGWFIRKSYTDDGFSGGNFERPAFQEMIDDAKSGLIDLILVKDLSRFGRDSVGVCYYTDELLPSLQCRFIALTDNIDTDEDDSDLLPILSILGDYYLKDISKKIRAVLRGKAASGECLMTYAPYGYEKSKEDKHKLVVDAYAAEVVRTIYRLRLERQGFAAIAKQLNAKGILPPRSYWNQKYGRKNHDGAANLWRDVTVKTILRNDIYLGHLTQMKTGTLSYKDKHMIAKDEDEWIRTENTHEAIISQEAWDAVQQIDLRKSTQSAAPTASLFTGMLVCSGCGSKLTCNTETHRRKNGRIVKYHSYHCPLYYQTGRSTCSTHTVYEIGLLELIKTDIQKYARQITYDEAHIQQELQKRLCKELPDVKFLEQELKLLRREDTDYNSKLTKLYEDKVLGRITESNYAMLLNSIQKSHHEKEIRLKELEQKMDTIQKKLRNISRWMKQIRKCLKLDAIDRSLLEEIINHIEIGERQVIDGKKQQEIKIVYRFVGSLGE